MCQKKNHQANQSIDLLVQHEKNSVKNCHCETKTKEEKKVNVPSKKSILHEQNPVKNYYILCNEGKEGTKKKLYLFLPFAYQKANTT